MTVQFYQSTDASAPVLSGTVGSLIAVLDACLVNGYGSKAAAGWTKAFSGTNTAAYRMSAVDGTGFYLNVDDSGPGGGGAREARMTGFETMSAIATGTGQFPLFSQLGIGIGATVMRKSVTADSTARKWYVLADDTYFVILPETGDFTNPIMTMPFSFGDIFSYRTNDLYRCFMIGRNAENTSFCLSEWFHAYLNSANILYHAMGGHFMARNYNGVGSSLQVGKHTDLSRMSMGVSLNQNNDGSGSDGQFLGTSNSISNGSAHCNMGCSYGNTVSFQFPNAVDGGLYMAPMWVHHSGFVRGYMKGIWAPQHHLPMNHGDIFSGTGPLAGKSFIALSILSVFSGSSPAPGQVFLETSNTWS